MSYITKTTYTADGVTDTFTFPFDVISPADISVSLDGVVTEQDDATNPWSPNSLANPTSVVFVSPPSVNVAVRIYRTTDRTDLYKEYDNSPLAADDLNKSFKQLLFIEQEGYDDLQEAEELFGSVGATPSPGDGQENNHFLVTSDGAWAIRSAQGVLDILGLGNDSDVVFNSLEVNSLSALELSAVSGTIENLSVENVSGGFTVSSNDSSYSVLKNDSTKDFIIQSAGDIVFRVDDTEAFRIDKTNIMDTTTNGLLHTYGDSLPAAYNSTQIGIALSGTGKVSAYNTTKAWATVIDTATTPTLTNDFGITSVVRNSTGNYTITFDTSILVNGVNHIIIPYIKDNYTAGVTIGVTSRSSNTFTIQVFSDVNGQTASDKDFHFQIF